MIIKVNKYGNSNHIINNSIQIKLIKHSFGVVNY